MKLKKILSLAVVLAMVLSIVPAFGLTASAAGASIDGMTLYVDGSYATAECIVKQAGRDTADVPASEWHTPPYQGWSSDPAYTGNANDRININGGLADGKNYIQFYNGNVDTTLTGSMYTLPYVKNTASFVVQWYADANAKSYDVDVLAADKTTVIGEFTFGTEGEVTPNKYYRAAFDKTESGYTFGLYSSDSETGTYALVKTQDYTTELNGFGGFTVTTTNCGGTYLNIRFCDMKIYGTAPNNEYTVNLASHSVSVSGDKKADYNSTAGSGNLAISSNNAGGANEFHALRSQYLTYQDGLTDLGGARVPKLTFNAFPTLDEGEDIVKAELSLHVTKTHNYFSNGWLRICAYMDKDNSITKDTVPDYLSTCVAHGPSGGNWNNVDQNVTVDITDWAQKKYADAVPASVDITLAVAHAGLAIADNPVIKIYTRKSLEASTEATVKNAVNKLSIASMARNKIDLPQTTTDEVGSTVNVTWTAEPSSIIDVKTGVVKTDDVTTVTLTPTGTVGDITATGSATTVTVFPGSLAGTKQTIGDVTYDVGENLIGDNADFSSGLAVWQDGTGAVINSAGFQAVKDGDVDYVKVVNYSSSSSGGGSPQALKRTISGLTVGQQYILAVTAKELNDEYAKFDYGSGEVAPFAKKSGWARQTAVFTAASDTLNIAFRWNDASYESFELCAITPDGSETTVKYVDNNGNAIKTVNKYLHEGETLTVEAQEVYFAPKTGETLTDDTSKTLTVVGAGSYYNLPAATAEVGKTTEVTVTPSTTKIGVVKDASVKDGTAEIYGIDNNNAIRVASTGDPVIKESAIDANGEDLATSAGRTTMGIKRYGLLEFPVVELADGQKAMLTVYIDPEIIENGKFKMHKNGFNDINGNADVNATAKFIAYVMANNDWPEDVKNYQGATPIAYDANKITANLEGTNAIYSQPAKYESDTITFDVTEAMKAAQAKGLSTLDIRLAAAYGGYTMVDREKAVVGASEYSAYAKKDLHEGKAAYIELVDAKAFEVTSTGSAILTKNGSAVSGTAIVTAEDDVRLVGGKDAVAVVTEDDIVYAVNKNLGLTAATNFVNATPCALGVTMVDGAQVRIGQKLTGDKIVPSKEGSGLRFIATIGDKDNLAVIQGAEVGILIYPNDAITDFDAANVGTDNNIIVIPATKYQDKDHTTFSVALTNLHESNYNRSFTAKPYVKIDGKYYTDDKSVTRSIYKVAAGLLTTGTTESEDNTDLQLMSNDAIAVLNAYLNQVGIRLNFDATAENKVVARTTGKGAYTGDAFFNVTSTEADGVYTITLTIPEGSKATFKSFWNEYVRINNNHSTVITGIKTVAGDAVGDTTPCQAAISEDEKTLTFTFTVPTPAAN